MVKGAGISGGDKRTSGRRARSQQQFMAAEIKGESPMQVRRVKDVAKKKKKGW